MGVPGLYSWVSRRFKTVANKKTDNRRDLSSHDTCDHLYIDLNHVLHSCSHSLGMPRDDGPLDGIFHNIAQYIDYIVSLAKPQKFIMLAVDGVAPKAKLSQQRTRRFLGAHRTSLELQIGVALKRKMQYESGQTFAKPESFDRNIITPGTPFMRELSELLNDYVDQRLKNNTEWQHLRVLLSTANEPGEGEHKIVRFIRDQRQREGYDPRTRHVIFGQDADLILLALMTHEPHFIIYREDLSIRDGSLVGGLPDIGELNIGKLRQFLKYGLDPKRPLKPEKNESVAGSGGETEEEGVDVEEHVPNFGFERTLEDFVFLTFLLGNDFLPSIPSLDIYDSIGGMDRILHCYKQLRKKETGFVTKNGSIDLDYLQKLLKLLVEDEAAAYGRIRKSKDKYRRRKEDEDRAPVEKPHSDWDKKNHFEKQGYVSVGSLGNQSMDEALGPVGHVMTLEEKEALKGPDLEKLNPEELAVELKKRLSERVDKQLLENSEKDDVHLGQYGFEERYYGSIGAAKHREEASRVSLDMGKAYTQGLCWSFAYYSVGPSPFTTTEDSLLLHKGDYKKKKSKGKKEKMPEQPKVLYAAWDWNYKYHYAPLIRDLRRACREATLSDVLRPGAIRQAAAGWTVNHGPVTPFVQLLSVLPAESADACLPNQLARLLKATKRDSDDILHLEESVKKMSKMFPHDMHKLVDSRGKTHAHTVVVRLPEVVYNDICHAARLAAESMTLTEEQEEGNTFNCGDLYMRKELCDKLKKQMDARVERKKRAEELSSDGRIDWTDDEESEKDKPDTILELVIPPFKDLLPDEEEEEETVRLGFDIAGVVSTDNNCRVCAGAFEKDEEPLECTQFFIKACSSTQTPSPAARPKEKVKK